MTFEEIKNRLAKSFAEHEENSKKYPGIYGQMISFDEIINMANVCKEFHSAVHRCDCDGNGIRIEFMFDNDAYASVIKNKYSDYEWEIMSPHIHNYDGILNHMSDSVMLENLRKISNGEDIGDYSDCEIWDEVYDTE